VIELTIKNNFIKNSLIYIIKYKLYSNKNKLEMLNYNLKLFNHLIFQLLKILTLE